MRHSVTREKGNAITLTLLGLAVAIVAGVAVIYYIGSQKPVPVPLDVPREIAEVIPERPRNPREGWNVYENSTYAFTLEYPGGWAIAEDEVKGVSVVTVYDAKEVLPESESVSVHDTSTRVSVYPTGVPMGGRGEREEPSVLTIPGADVTDYVLGSSGKPWASVVRFSTFPTSWTEDNFLYARVRILDEVVTYVRGEDEMVSEEEFDAFAGDRTVRDGFADTSSRAMTEEILRSFRFLEAGTTSSEGNDAGMAVEVADMITVTAPTAGALVGSPLLVSGEARGKWYFEGDFPIEVRTEGGEVVAQVPAPALGEWMTESYVPFEVSIPFDAGTATSGVVRFIRDNPSGLPEFDRFVEVPVRF